MSRRPSMFSRNYQRQLKKRRLRYVAVISTIGLFIIILIFSGELKLITSNFRAFKNSTSSQQEIKKEEVIKDIDNSIPDENKEPVEPQLKEEIFDIALNSQQSLKVTIVIEENKKMFKEVVGSGTITYNISPSKDRIAISDDLNQELYIIDINKNITNVTKKEYVSTKKDIFKRETILAQIEKYVWAEKPTFIDDTHIAYASNLPWLNKSGTKYLWIIDTATGEHKSYSKIKGDNFQFGELTSKGLTLTIDNNTVFIDINGRIIM